MVLTLLAILLLVLTLPFSLFFCIRVVKENERLVVFRFSQVQQHGPGLCFVIPFVDRVERVDVRSVCLCLPPQEVLTSDSVSIVVQLIAWYRVFDPVKAVTIVRNFTEATHFTISSQIQKAIGEKKFSQLTSQILSVHSEGGTLSSTSFLSPSNNTSRITSSIPSSSSSSSTSFADALLGTLDTRVNKWGVQVEKLQVKDIRLPDHLHKILTVEATAKNDVQSKVAMSQGEVQSAHFLASAARTMQGDAMKLKYLQVISKVTQSGPSTIVAPIALSTGQLYSSFFSPTTDCTLPPLPPPNSTPFTSPSPCSSPSSSPSPSSSSSPAPSASC